MMSMWELSVLFAVTVTAQCWWSAWLAKQVRLEREAHAETKRKLMEATPIKIGGGAARETFGCGRCFECLDPLRIGFLSPAQMIVCPDCGNKRCPKATLHTFRCTGSNEPGQPGSRYGASK